VVLEIITVVVIALAAFSHWRAGIWSAVLSLWASLLAGAVAFGLYVPLSHAFFGGESKPGEMQYFWCDGLMLILLFVISFAVLRIVSEHLLRNRMAFKPMADSIGGAAIGALTGYVAAGVLAVFAQMMPLSPTSVLGYQPFDAKTGRRANHLATHADDVVLGLYNSLLGGALSGREGNLASLYEAGEPGSAVAPGDSAEDILRYYFRRRSLLAMEAAGLRPFKYGEDKGVPLVGADGELVVTPHGIENNATAILVQSVEVVRYGDWVKNVQSLAAEKAKLLRETVEPLAEDLQKALGGKDELALAAVESRVGQAMPGALQAEWDEYERLTRVKEKQELLEKWLDGGSSSVSWTSPSGTVMRPGSDSKDVAVLLVTLSFGPGSTQAVNKSLSDWTLVPGFAVGDYDAASRPKLVGLAVRTEEDGLSTLTPKEPEGQPSLLNDGVAVESYRRDSDDDTVEYFADAASWSFESEEQRTEATLAFLVPATASPEWYGICCAMPKPKGGGSKAGSKVSTNKEGLIKGRKGEVAGLKWDILDVTWAATVISAKEPAKGNELVVVKMKWTQKDAKQPVLVKAADLWLENTTLGKKYPARLREVLETKKGEEAPTPKRTLSSRTADILVEEKPATASLEKYSEQLSEKWELFLKGSGYATVDLVFEVPTDRMADNYTFGVSDTVSHEQPEWYGLRTMATIRSSTHDVARNRVGDKESIALVNPSDGRVMPPWSPSSMGGQKLLSIAVNLQTRKPGDQNYYEVPLKDFRLKASGDKAIDLYAYRLEGETAFRRYDARTPAIVRLQGTKELELIYLVSKESEGLQLTLAGFSRVIKVDE
jgi:uncharacterized membrane protein required for colicin V production